MAEVKSWLKGANGRVGGLTLYQSGGKTIARESQSSAKDANSFAQAIQRVFMKTVSDQYSAYKIIADHSFQGKSAGRQCMSKFLSDNLNMFRERAAQLQNAGESIYDYYQFAHKGQQKFVPTSIILSRGSLPRILAGIDNNGAFALMQLNQPTYKGVIDQYGLKRGDQLTFIDCEKNAMTGDYVVNVARVILDPRDVDGTPLPLSIDLVDGSNHTIAAPNMRNSGAAFFDLGHGGLLFKFNVGQVAAAGIIVSRKERGQWQRSFCKLAISEAVLDTDLQSLGAAADASLEAAEIYTDSALYLNNAGTGGVQGAPEVVDDSDIVVSNLVTINGVEQDVSGGEVTIGNQLTGVVVNGRNIPDAYIVLAPHPGQAEPIPFTGSGNTVRLEAGIITNQNLTVTIRKDQNPWFNINLRVGGGME